jgi:phosphatidylglycerophosphate synthase
VPSSPSNAPGFAARWAAIRGKAYEDWWCRAIGGPIGNVIAAALAPVGAVSADLVTGLSAGLRLGGALAIARGPGGELAAALLLQLGALLDVVDGGLARLRGPTHRGAFLDKALDMICLAAVCGAAGWRVAGELDARWPLAAAGFVAWSVLLRGYLLWVVRGQTRQAGRAVPPPPPDRPDAPWPRRVLRALADTPRALFVGESDLYFWIALALVVDRLPLALAVLALALAPWLVVVAGLRLIQAARLDRPAP